MVPSPSAPAGVPSDSSSEPPFERTQPGQFHHLPPEIQLLAVLELFKHIPAPLRRQVLGWFDTHRSFLQRRTNLQAKDGQRNLVREGIAKDLYSLAQAFALDRELVAVSLTTILVRSPAEEVDLSPVLVGQSPAAPQSSQNTHSTPPPPPPNRKGKLLKKTSTLLHKIGHALSKPFPSHKKSPSSMTQDQSPLAAQVDVPERPTRASRFEPHPFLGPPLELSLRTVPNVRSMEDAATLALSLGAAAQPVDAHLTNCLALIRHRLRHAPAAQQQEEQEKDVLSCYLAVAQRRQLKRNLECQHGKRFAQALASVVSHQSANVFSTAQRTTWSDLVANAARALALLDPQVQDRTLLLASELLDPRRWTMAFVARLFSGLFELLAVLLSHLPLEPDCRPPPVRRLCDVQELALALHACLSVLHELIYEGWGGLQNTLRLERFFTHWQQAAAGLDRVWPRANVPGSEVSDEDHYFDDLSVTDTRAVLAWSKRIVASVHCAHRMQATQPGSILAKLVGTTWRIRVPAVPVLHLQAPRRRLGFHLVDVLETVFDIYHKRPTDLPKFGLFKISDAVVYFSGKLSEQQTESPDLPWFYADVVRHAEVPFAFADRRDPKVKKVRHT